MRWLFDAVNHALMRFLSIRIEVPRDHRYRLKSAGGGLGIGRRVELQCPERITVGSRVTINSDSYLAGDGGIEIGDDVLIGPQCMIFTMNHVYANPRVPIRDQGYEYRPVRLGPDVWVGAGAIILAGVTIGRGAVVAAGAVVRGDVPDYTVVGGVPARVLGRRG